MVAGVGSRTPSGGEGGTRIYLASGGDDDGLLRLVLPALDQSPLEEGNGRVGVKVQSCPWLGQGIEAAACG